MVRALTVTLNMFAFITAFLGIYLSFSEALIGILLNILGRFMPDEKINRKVLNICVAVGVVVALWTWVCLGSRVLTVIQFGAMPLALVSTLIPCYLVCKIPALRQFRSPAVLFIFLFGIVFFISPLFKILE